MLSLENYWDYKIPTEEELQLLMDITVETDLNNDMFVDTVQVDGFKVMCCEDGCYLSGDGEPTARAVAAWKFMSLFRYDQLMSTHRTWAEGIGKIAGLNADMVLKIGEGLGLPSLRTM